MIRTYKKRFYPTPAQAEQLEGWLAFACMEYNAALQTVKDPWRQNQRHRYRFWDSEANEWVWRDARPPVASADMNAWGAQLTEFRQAHPELLPDGMPALVQHEVLARVRRTVKALYARAASGKKAGTPRYRKAQRYNSLTFNLTAPSRPPAELSEEWLVEHVAKVQAATEIFSGEAAAGRQPADVKAKDLKAIVGDISLEAARSLRALTLTELGFEVPPGVTSGVGSLRNDTLYLAGLGAIPLLHGARRRRVGSGCDSALGQDYLSAHADDLAWLKGRARGLIEKGRAPKAITVGQLRRGTRIKASVVRRLRRTALGLSASKRSEDQPKRIYGLRVHRDIPEAGIPRTVTLTRSCGRWYICLSIELPSVAPQSTNDDEVGIDLGKITWLTGYSPNPEAIAAVDTDLGRQQPPIHHVSEANWFRVEGAGASKRHARHVRRLQRVVARRTRRGHAHSHRRRKAVDAYARVKEAERNLRADHRHKVTRVLARHFKHIAMEDLGVKEMTRAPKNDTDREQLPARKKEELNREILDRAWYALRTDATYKVEETGGSVVAVPPEHTTDTCSECGEHVPMSPLMRWFKCSRCGYAVSRTYNSARNVHLRRRAGVSKQALPDGAHPSGVNRPLGGGLRTSPSSRPRSTSGVRKKEGG